MSKLKKAKSTQANPSRRSFLRKIWTGLGILAGLEFVGLPFAFLWPGKRRRSGLDEARMVVAGAVDDFVPNSVTAFRSGYFYLARLGDGGFLALSYRCSHLGCSVEWQSTEARFICPCHSSVFDITGNVLSPPAPRALNFHPVMIENDMVKVNTGKWRQRKRFGKSQVAYA